MASERNRTVWIVVILVLVVMGCCIAATVGGTLLFLPVREEVTQISVEQAPPTEQESVEPALSGLAQEAEEVAALIPASSAGWAVHVTGVSTTTVLLRPVIIVATDIDPEQAGLSDEFVQGLSSYVTTLVDADGSPYTYYIRILSAEGDAVGATAFTDARWALDAPAPPNDVVGLTEWLREVYGKGADEAWLGRIASAEIGPDGVIVLRTDLDPANRADLSRAQTMIDAVNSSGASFASGIRVLFADGVYEWSALLDGVDPYGP